MDDLSYLSLRALMTLARERLGRAAASLKTRDELLAALRGEPPAPEPELERAPVVTRDFFVRHAPRPSKDPR